MSMFDPTADDEIIYVVEDVEAAEKQMKENNGKFSGNLIPKIKNPKSFKMVVVEGKEGVEIWDDVLRKLTQNGKTKVRKDIYEKTHKWKKQQFQYFAAVVNEKTGDSPVMALLSRKSEKFKYFINHISTASPMMPLPYVGMLLSSLEKMAFDQGSGLIIPKKYQVCTDAPIEVEADEGQMYKVDAKDMLVDATKV